MSDSEVDFSKIQIIEMKDLSGQRWYIQRGNQYVAGPYELFLDAVQAQEMFLEEFDG